MATTVDIDEAKQKLTELLDLARAGNEVFIAENDRPVARLTAIVSAPEESRVRVAGLHAGAIWVSEDFDEELPEAFWLGES